MSARPAAFPVTLVGAGPGDPELLTLKAVKALGRATVALVDDLVDEGVLAYLPAGCRIVPVGKRGGCASTPQDFIIRLMIAQARQGERVVRLKGGDPFVFGRGAEEAHALREAGIPVEVVSGLTAGIAGPAALGIPVTDRRFSRGVALVTGHSQPGGEEPDWAALARSGLTLVIYMGMSNLAAITQALIRGGMDPDMPAAAVCAAHTPGQRHSLASLHALREAVVRDRLGSPAIVIIGEVVRCCTEAGELDLGRLAPVARTAT